MSTCRASCADRFGRNPKLHDRKSASKTGSSTIFIAACTTRPRTAAIASGLRPALPGLGISTFRAGSGHHVPSRNWMANSPSSRVTPVHLDICQGGLVDARCTVVAAQRDPRPPQDVLAVDLRLPPGTPLTSRLLTGYRTALAGGHRSPLRPDPLSSRRHLLNVPRPLRRGVPRGCISRIFTASMAFTVNRPDRLSHNVYRRGRLRLRCGPLSCSHHVAFDAGLRPGPFPDQTASLLPGSLATTRTGLSPAGDDELPIRS